MLNASSPARASALAILFVNIGWADKYDGYEDIRGNHTFLREHPDDNAEHMAFEPDRNGVYCCGIGRGRLEAERLDVVFVARNQESSGHRAVGLYRDAWWEADDPSERRPWIRAYTTNAELIPTAQRPRVAWPGRREMRRWASRAGGKGREYQHLRDAHGEILSLLDEIRRPSPPPVAPRPKFTPPTVRSKAPPSAAALLPQEDVDLIVLKEGTTEIHRQRHNAMTNALREICINHNMGVHRGNTAASLYDALICRYAGAERDLLVEVKTSVAQEFCRMAVGQLLDYRRALPRRDSTDLAVLLPEEPDAHARAFLAEVGIMVLWLTPDRQNIRGDLWL